jgi:hypothetical protein
MYLRVYKEFNNIFYKLIWSQYLPVIIVTYPTNILSRVPRGAGHQGRSLTETQGSKNGPPIDFLKKFDSQIRVPKLNPFNSP